MRRRRISAPSDVLPRSLIKWLVNHASDDDITEGYAADWAVEQLRKPAQQIAARTDKWMCLLDKIINNKYI